MKIKAQLITLDKPNRNEDIFVERGEYKIGEECFATEHSLPDFDLETIKTAMNKAKAFIDNTPVSKATLLRVAKRYQNGRKPPGGRTLRKKRLRKKFHQWLAASLTPRYNIGEAIDATLKFTDSNLWNNVAKAYSILSENFMQTPKETSLLFRYAFDSPAIDKKIHRFITDCA